MTPSPLTTTSNHPQTRIRITMKGLLQGIGFRPFVYRLAQNLSLG
ncbi:MAG: hypothetical protein GKS05_05585 [Nitrospirales bacterium]|nr:hypothetical protein [Nitrospirales bacterium]